MTKPPLELVPPPEPDQPPPTASGLDESQIAAEDLRALHALVRLRRLDLGAGCAVRELPLPDIPLEVRQAKCDLDGPRILKLKIAPLPKNPHRHWLKLAPWSIRLKRDLKLALRMPVRRRRLLEGELSREREQALYRRLFEQHGAAARELEVLAVFGQVPVEAAASLVLSSDLRYAEFRLPAQSNPHQVAGGTYLLVLKDAQGKLRKLIMRLESHA